MKPQLKGIIVLDGHDGAGKSTLAQNLVRANGGGKIIHCSYRFKKSMFNYHLAVLRRACRLAEHTLVIIDRFWLSEDIYAYVYRGGSEFPLAGHFYDRILLKHAALNIVCATDPEHAAQHYTKLQAERAELYADNQQATICSLYLKVYDGWDMPRNPHGYGSLLSTLGASFGSRRMDFKRYDFRQHSTSTDDLSYAYNALDRLLELQSKQPEYLRKNSTRNFLGSLAQSAWVIVGDQVNHADYRKTWPFTSYGASSLYVTKALHDQGIDESKLIWTNASCEEDHLLPLSRHETYSKKRYIALGCAASDRLTQLKIEHRKVAHPAAAMRFGKPYAVYGYELMKEMTS